MEQFGSQQFANVKFRDSFVMIGQRGVAKGKAIELAEPKGTKDFAKAATISGCADFPRELNNFYFYLKQACFNLNKFSINKTQYLFMIHDDSQPL